MSKNLIIAVLFLITVSISVSGWKSNNSYPVFFDRNGQMNASQIKVFADTSLPSTGNGFSIDISSAGFSAIRSVSVTAQSNTASVSSMPIVVIKSITTSAIVVNILSQNNSTTTILGITVLSGSPLQTIASTTGVVLNVKIVGT